MIRIWLYIGSALAMLAILGSIYAKGYMSCEENNKVENAEKIIERSKRDAKTEREVLTASEHDIRNRFSRWVLND